MAEVDRFLVKQLGRHHSHCYHVPSRPHGFPLGDGGNGEMIGGSKLAGRLEEREYKRRPLEEPQRVTRGGVHPTLNRTKFRVREQGEDILVTELGLSSVDGRRRHSKRDKYLVRILHGNLSGGHQRLCWGGDGEGCGRGFQWCRDLYG